MPESTFNFSISLIDSNSGLGIPGLLVEVWDKDEKYDSLLGREYSDQQGKLSISFDETYYGDYSPDLLPDVYFKVFSGGSLLHSTRERVVLNVPKGNNSFVINVNTPINENIKRPKTEVAIHELGESIAVSLSSVQQELARYPNNLGAFLLDEMDLEIPVALRVDSLGQVMATVSDSLSPDTLIGRLRLKVRPVLGAAQPLPVTSDQSLQDLGLLSQEVIDSLGEQRIFSVDDLLRVSRNAAGRKALQNAKLGTDLEGVLGAAEVLALPNIPAPVRKALLQAGVKKPADLCQVNSKQFAKILSEKLGQQISEDDVTAWQEEVKPLVAIPLPSHRPDFPKKPIKPNLTEGKEIDDDV